MWSTRRFDREVTIWLRSGDPRAEETLKKDVLPKLQASCRHWLKNPEDAEDLTHAALVKLLSLESPPDSFRAWLWTVARRLCLNRNRDEKGDVLPLDKELAQSMTGHLTGLVKAEEEARLRRALAALTSLQKEVIRLRYVDLFSRQEISQIQDVPLGTVKSRLFEALKALKRKLESP